MGAGALGLTMSEPTDEEQSFLDKNTFAKGGAPITWKDGDNTYYYDAAMIGPYDPVWAITKAVAEAASNPKEWKKGMAGVWESITDLGSSNALITNALKAMAGKAPSLAKRDPASYAAVVQKLKDMGVGKETANKLINLMQLGPKFVFEYYRGQNEQGASAATKAAMSSGVGVERLDPTTTLANYLGGGFQAELKDARSSFTSLIKSPASTTPQEIEAGFVESMQDIIEPYQKLEAAVELAKAQGTPNAEIVKALKAGGVPVIVAGMLMSGDVLPARIVFTDLKASAEQDILRAQREGTNPEATLQKWKDNMKALGRIASKYKNVTVEDVMSGELDG
jgi:hypothetical protein